MRCRPGEVVNTKALTITRYANGTVAPPPPPNTTYTLESPWASHHAVASELGSWLANVTVPASAQVGARRITTSVPPPFFFSCVAPVPGCAPGNTRGTL